MLRVFFCEPSGSIDETDNNEFESAGTGKTNSPRR